MVHARSFIKGTLFCLFCAFLASCSGKESYVAYYFSYDTVDVRESPSDDAAVVLKLSCGRKPAKYDKKTAEIPYVFLSTDSNESPVGIQNVDESGKWGYMGKGWVRLDDMIYVGTGDETAKLPAFKTQGGEWLTIYKHPKDEASEKSKHSIRQQEIVQQFATVKNWTFIHAIVHSTVGVPHHLYGWMKNSNLNKVEDASEEEMKSNGYQLLEERTGKKSLQFNRTMYFVFRYAAGLALLLLLIFLVPAFVHGRPAGALFTFPIFSILLFFFGELGVGFTVLYGFLTPLVWYVILYPLLYTKASTVFPPAYSRLSIITSLLVMGLNEWTKGSLSFGHILLIVLYLVPVVFFSFFVSRRAYNAICPLCHYYGNHRLLRTVEEGTTTSKREGVDDIYTGTTTEIRGGSKVEVNHYKRVPYTLISTTTYYREERQCRHCDEIFYVHRMSSGSRKI